MTGTTLAHYRIDDELGRGGMGIVYRAFDTKLDRTVALKVLPAAALASEDDRARFYREAKAAAQLHHPNIATVFEIGEAVPSDAPHGAEPRPFIAMEFVDGITLSEHIKKGPVGLTEAVSVAGQVAEALKEAHGKEIVHRDIKSANVMLTTDGIAKVLDFGLAKTNASTMLTRMGSTLGTVAYMSPEQARGQEVDGRTDLYSLGTMLYEMVAGRLPYAGDYEQAVLYAILNEPPEPLTALRTGVPMDLERVVGKLLAKEAEYRYQSAAGLLADLKSLDVTGSGHSRRTMPAMSAARTETAPVRKAVLPMWAWGLVAAGVLIGGLAGWLAKPTPEQPPDDPAVRFNIPLDDTESFARMFARSVAVSPDGATLAYLTGSGIRLRRTDDLSRSVQLGGPEDPRGLFFSPDSEWIGYEDVEAGRMMKVRLAGGSPVPITDLPHEASGSSWGGDGYVYIGFGSNGMGRVPEGGGVVEMLAASPDSGGFRRPSILPDWRTLLYTRHVGLPWNEAQIRLRDLETGRDWLLHDGGFDASYMRTGHVLFVWESSLYALPFDVDALEATGGQVPVSDNISNLASGVAHYDVSDNGTLLKITGRGSSGTTLDWLSGDGTLESLSPDSRLFQLPRVQPTGGQVAVEIEGDTWLYDANRGTSVRLVAAGGRPIWSPDGQHVAYSAGSYILARRPSEPEVVDTLFHDGTNSFLEPTDWSPDGRFILFNVGSAGASDIRYLDLESGTSSVFLENDFDVDFGAFSPDGQWVAYESDELERNEVFIRRFPGGEDRLRISREGGDKAVWRRDGRAIYYTNNAGHIETAEVDPEGAQVGATRIVYDGPVEPTFGFHLNPVDGRLLIRSTQGPGSESGSRLDLVVHFSTEVKAGS